MSILSVARKRLLAGENPFAVFRDTKVQVDSWVSKAAGNMPPDAKATLDAVVAEVKQGLSNAAAGVADMLPALLVGPTLAIDDGFAVVASAYLGPVVGGILSKAQADALNKIEAEFIAQVKSAKLTHIAAVTGASAPPAEPSALHAG